MKKLLLALSILFASVAHAQWTTLNSGTTQDLYSVCFVDANIGWVVGEVGTILKTTDGGAHWTPQSSGVSERLSSVCFLDDNRGFAVGVNGTYVQTTDPIPPWACSR